MTKKLICLLITIAMVLTMLPGVAFAANTAGLDNFKKVQTYTDGQFTDVTAKDWFEENVAAAYELNLMVGRSGKFFDTESNLTVAEAMTIAARLREIYYTGKAEFVQGQPWHQVYTDYCKENKIADPADYDLNKAITRGQFAEIFSKAFPEEALKKINNVQDNMIPDVSKTDKFSAAIYLLYRAGILTGNDSKGTFASETNIKRIEAAAITTRMAQPTLRKSITLVKQSSGGGSYTPPAPAIKTVEDVLATVEGGFPTSLDYAWMAANGNKCYRTNNDLYFIPQQGGLRSIGLDKNIEKSGDNYVYRDELSLTVTFHMTDNVLTSITFAFTNESSIFDGTYSKPVTYTVTFDLNGITGTAPTAQTIVSGGKVTEPTTPTDTNHTFAGWYKTKDTTTGKLSNPWNLATSTVTEDITLYAQWTRTTESILNTNDDIAKSPSTTQPSGAWINSNNSDCKAFIGVVDDKQCFIVNKKDSENFGLNFFMDETFIKVGDNYMQYDDAAGYEFTCYMSNGKFVSAKYKDTDVKYSNLVGTYVPANTTFKAVYDATGGENTLTFYYDAVDYSGEGIAVYEGSTGDYYLFNSSKSNYDLWGYNQNNEEKGIAANIKSVIIDESVKIYDGLTSTAFMFQGMTTATTISGAEYLDVSNVTDMSYMFNNFGGGANGSPTTLNSVPNVSGWNTGSVTTMAGMFESYGNFSSKLDKVPDVSNWNTGNVTNMFCMFQKYGHESTSFNAVPDVSKWNTGKVTDMTKMFKEYSHKSTALNFTLDLSGWSVESVNNYGDMFNAAGAVASTWSVTIPAKTGNKQNETGKWYVGDGTIDTKFIAPATGKQFTLATSCIAAGTMISMPGGKQKAVEELEIGDIICTFDHEAGKVSSAPVCYIWESKNVANAFTLTFEDDIEVTVIEEHGFYDREEQKYVFINFNNAKEYIGHHFYNADSNSWLELKSCVALKDRVDSYAIITSGHLNHMSNGMLSMCDGSVKVLANIFEYDDQMKFDAEKKLADIKAYGLTSKEKIREFKGFLESDYDDYKLQYLNVAIGKGLTTWEWIKAFSDYCVANGL